MKENLTAINKCVFLDRDGVINEERGDYTYKTEDFIIIPGVKEAIKKLNDNSYKVIVITNQSGISKGYYSIDMMHQCHEKMMKETEGLIDDIYYAIWNPDVSASIMRKPDSLMLERAAAKYQIMHKESWMIGDKERDIEAGQKANLKTILISSSSKKTKADFTFDSLIHAVDEIIA